MKETSMSSSIQSSHNGPYFIMSDSDDSISNIRNTAFIPNESDRIVMVSPPESDEDEEVSHAPPVAGETMELDGVIDLVSDTEIEVPKRLDFGDGDTLPVAVENMDLDGESVGVEAKNGGVVGLETDLDFGVSKRTDFDDGNSSTDTEELLLSLKNCCPESESESELEAGGSSRRRSGLDISTEMQSGNISRSMEKNKEPINGTEDEKQNVIGPKDEKKRFNILDLLRKLAREEEDSDFVCLSLLEVAEQRWGKF